MAKESLASKKNREVTTVESNPGAGLPVGYSGGALAPVVQTFIRTPYVQFISTKGQSFAEVAAVIRDLQDGDPVLRREDVRPVKLNPFKFYLINAFQHWSLVDNLGSIVKTTLDPEQGTANKWAEHVETLLIVQLPDGSLSPARCTFKTTKTNAIHAAIKARTQAEDADEWGGLSAEHKESLAVPAVWARYMTTVTLKRGTGKASGFAFVAANGFVSPTGLADWKALAAAFQDGGFKKLADATRESFDTRVADLKSRSV